MTWIVSFSGAVPSHSYVPEWNGELFATVPVDGELESEPDFPSQVAVSTPFWPRPVSSSLNGALSAACPIQSVVPLRYTPAGLPDETVIGEPFVIFATAAT